MSNILFSENVANNATKYVEVPVRDGAVGAHIAWKDATSAVTVTLELSSFDDAAAQIAGQAWEWKDSGLTITGPAGAAAGSVLVNVENVRQHRARLKLVATATSYLEVRDGTGA